jgi:glucokinase
MPDRSETTTVSEPVTVAVDLGGTHVRVALVGADGRVLDRIRTETPHRDPAPDVIVELVRKVAAEATTEIRRCVVGVPGVVDYDREQLVAAPNLPQGWIPDLCETWLAARTGLEVAMANDADLAAVGESSFGAGTDARDVVYVTISTGVGAGIVLGQRLVHGRYSGGEIGHTVIDRSVERNGDDGTVEGLGSGTAMKVAAQAIGLDVAGAAFADLVRSADARATGIWEDAIDAVAVGVTNLCWLVTPHMVVVGGGVGMNTDLVLPRIRDRVAANGPAIDPIQVVAASLGDDAALCGAAAWWKAIGREN